VRRRIGGVAVAALLAATAGAALHRVIMVAQLWPVLVVSAGVPALLALLFSLGRWPLPLWLAAPASAAAWLGAASLLPASGHSPGGVADAARALPGAWSRLLALRPDTPATYAQLAAVSALVWLGSAAAAELLLRTRAGLTAALPSLGVLLTGAALGLDGPGSDIGVAAAYAGGVGLLLLLRRNDIYSGRTWAAGLAVAATVAVAAGLAGPLVPFATARAPLDPHRYAAPAALPGQLGNPLDLVPVWLADPQTRLFTVDTSTGQDWRVAVLDRFDGTTWSTGATFVPAPPRLAAPATSAPTTALAQEYTVDGLVGAWLPAAAQPVQLTQGAGALLTDPATGVLVSPGQLLRGQRYSVVSRVPSYSAAQLRDATPDPAAAPALALPPGLPDVVTEQAQQATAGAGTPWQRAAALAAYLRGSAVNDPGAPPGHTYGHIAYFLAVSHRGTTEQFAVAYALMARSIGLPARIAVGFAPGTRTPDGHFAVSGADALVWPEVAFAGLGWVPFFPTPQPGGTPGGPDVAGAGTTPQRERLDASVASPGATPGPVATTAAARGAAAGVPLSVQLGGALGVLIVIYVCGVLAAPVWRRRGRRRAGVIGAWADARERLGPLRLGPAEALTTEEQALRAGQRLPQPVTARLLALAEATDAAVYSGHSPDAGAAARSWLGQRELSRAVRRSAGWARVVRHRLRPSAFRSGRFS
jgi:transglutaminase-like putative cysteine protease